MANVEIIEITENNATSESLFCIKNPKYPGFQLKLDWLKKRRKEGLKMMMLKVEGAVAGFIEYVPAEFAWRPVNAPGHMFIHCLWVYPKKNYNQGYASKLINHCCEEALYEKMQGVVVQVSNGSWMAGSQVFEKNGFCEVDKKERYQLLVKKLKDGQAPSFKPWESNLDKYKGLNLIYANQCPFFIKSVEEMKKSAKALGYDLKVKVLETASEAQDAPSGYGVYSLVYEGRLYADHYISNTRFKNILNRELI